MGAGRTFRGHLHRLWRAPGSQPHCAGHPVTPERFASVVGKADRIVVVDPKTTGVFPSDRVVEVVLVTSISTELNRRYGR